MQAPPADPPYNATWMKAQKIGKRDTHGNQFASVVRGFATHRKVKYSCMEAWEGGSGGEEG